MVPKHNILDARINSPRSWNSESLSQGRPTLVSGSNGSSTRLRRGEINVNWQYQKQRPRSAGAYYKAKIVPSCLVVEKRLAYVDDP